MECKEIINLLERIAPPECALSWDNVGLLVGRDNKDVKKIMIALDCTDSVISQAIKANVDMLITHHPLIFSPLKRINYNDYIGRKVYKLAVNDISYFAAHTNMDTSVMADEAAKMLDMVNIRPLELTYSKKMYKLVVFAPEQSAQRIMSVMEREGAAPYISGTNDNLNTREVRIESVLTNDIMDKVIKIMLKAHPYEFVKYDVYELINSTDEKGIGKAGYLEEEMTLTELANFVKERFMIDHVIVSGDPNKRVVRAAISPGAGKSMIKHALKAGVDVLITGDIDHHSAIDALDQGLCIIDAGHFGTEYFVVDYIKDYLERNIYTASNDIFSDASSIQIFKASEVSPFYVL